MAAAAFGRAKADWFGTFLDLPDGTPSHDTFDRLFGRLDLNAFERCFRLWTSALAGDLSGLVLLDGKKLRHSFDAAAGKAAILMVSLWAGDIGLVFGQQAVDEKSNEITEIPKLLELLDIKGCTVTIDAIGCQKDIAAAITARGAEYVLAVKDNQPTLHADVSAAFDRAERGGWGDRAHETHEEIDKGHGRLERRVTTITWDPRSLVGAMGWPSARCLVRVRRERTLGVATTVTTHHSLSSMETRRLALNALGRDQTQMMGIKNKRLLDGWDHASCQSTPEHPPETVQPPSSKAHLPISHDVCTRADGQTILRATGSRPRMPEIVDRSETASVSLAGASTGISEAGKARGRSRYHGTHALILKSLRASAAAGRLPQGSRSRGRAHATHQGRPLTLPRHADTTCSTVIRSIIARPADSSLWVVPAAGGWAWMTSPAR